MDSALLAGMMKLGVLSAKPSARGLGLAMSSSITTRVGWGTQSSFSEGPSSGPWVVLDRRFRVEGRWMRLKGSRHKCSGSGDLVCEDHVACWGGEAGGWLWIESRWLLRCRRVVVSSWGTRGTMWAVITSSSTTARTLREAFSKGEGAARDCSLGRLGLLAPHSTRARGWRHRRGRPGGLESPGKSMGKAAAPGSPWGIPGCSLGWGGGAGERGVRASPSPGAPPFNGQPAAPGSPWARALGSERAPPAGRLERVSSRCRRPRLVDHPRTRTGTCQENLACSGPGSPTARASGAFVPAESALRSPRISWDPGPERLTFRRVPLQSSSTASEWPRTPKQYSHTLTVPPAPRIP